MKTTDNFDEVLAEELLNLGKINPQAVKASALEARVNGESLSQALVRNGFIKQDDIVDVILRINPEALFNEDIIAPHVPANFLKENQIMLTAITYDEFYISTNKSEMAARELITPYFPTQEINFVPIDLTKFEKYMDKLQELSRQQEGENLDALLRRAIQEGVSDIHILPNYDTFSISFRNLGVKYIIRVSDIIEFHPLIAQIKDRSKMDLAENRIPQDGAFSIDYNSRMIDFRVATVPAQYGETVVMRILDPENAQTNLDTLGITNIEEWRKGMSRANGLCLICGPTGSGKTTTLNSTMKELDRFGKAIFSVEDPVEYKLPYITQVNANKQLGLDFQDAVKAFMRSDPDIIIVGEVRDLNTAQNMMRAAETGHLVFATLHTETIRGAITRLKDIGIESTELKYVLRTVLVQNLIRVPCKSCWGKGCLACNDRGYVGRNVVSECAYFPSQSDVERLLDENEEKWWADIIDDAFLKLKEGITTVEELFRVYGEEARMVIEKNKDIMFTEFKEGKLSQETFVRIYGDDARDFIESLGQTVDTTIITGDEDEIIEETEEGEE